MKIKKYITSLVVFSLIICLFSGFVFAAETDVDEGLMVHWLFDGEYPEGTEVYGELEFVEGKIGQALQFDNETGYLEVDEDIEVHSEQITISYWIKRTADDWIGDEYIVFWAKADGNHQSDGWFLLMDARGDDHHAIRLWVDGDDRFEYTSDINLLYPQDTWVHIAVAYDSTENEAYFYRNGDLIGTLDVPENYSMTPYEGTSWMGVNSPEFGSSYMDGIIDDFRIYNRILDEEEVQQIKEEAEE